ncbi:hypothetical protein F444_09879, partial [Phytophthora nicotianae P1976]
MKVKPQRPGQDGRSGQATGTVRHGDGKAATQCESVTKDERVEDVMKGMANEMKVKDAERAARYVATLRPAMAVTRFVRTEREREQREYEMKKKQREAEEGENARAVAT